MMDPKAVRYIRRELEKPLVRAIRNGHDKRVMAYGLLATGLEMCRIVCEESGSASPKEEGEALARQLMQDVLKSGIPK